MNLLRLCCCTILCCSMTALTFAEPPVDKPADGPAKPAAPTPPTPPAPPAAKPAPVVVSLMEAGAEPRRVLRLTPVVGSEQTVKLSIRTRTQQTVGALPVPDTIMPEAVYTMKVHVDEVADGTVSYRVQCVEAKVEPSPGVQPQLLELVSRAAANLVRTVAQVRATDRGLVTSMEFSRVPRDPTAEAQLEGIREALGRLMIPMPEEAIGVGGVWQVYSLIESGGFTINSTTVVKVTRLDDEGYDAELSLILEADEQEMDVPGAPPGSSARLVRLDAEGGGAAERAFSAMLPRDATLSTRTKANIDLDAPAMSMSMTQETRVAAKLREREAKEAEEADDE